MRLAARHGWTLQTTENLTATELLAWLALDRPEAKPPPTRIEDFFGLL